MNHKDESGTGGSEIEVPDGPLYYEAGHLTQTRGYLEDGQVRVERQGRKHTFGRGTSDAGPPYPIYSGSVGDAMELYRVLKAFFENPDEDLRVREKR